MDDFYTFIYFFHPYTEHTFLFQGGELSDN